MAFGPEHSLAEPSGFNAPRKTGSWPDVVRCFRVSAAASMGSGLGSAGQTGRHQLAPGTRVAPVRPAMVVTWVRNKVVVGGRCDRGPDKGVWLYPSTTRGLGVQGELLSVAARSVWGKSDRETGESMPLHRHMSDAAAVAGLLWDRWLPLSVRRLLGRDRPEGHARALVVWMAAVHDLGKASPAFGVQVEGLADRMNRCGLPVPASIPPAERRCAPHSVVSHVLLRRWLVEDMQFHPSVADSYAIVAGGHHGVTPSSQAIRVADRAHLLGTERWVVVQRELAEFAVDVSGAREYFSQWRTRPLPPRAQVLLTATVIVADWIASDSTLFPYVDERSSASRAEAAWRDIGLTSPWQPCDVPRVEELFQCRFDLPVDAVLRPVRCGVGRPHVDRRFDCRCNRHWYADDRASAGEHDEDERSGRCAVR